MKRIKLISHTDFNVVEQEVNDFLSQPRTGNNLSMETFITPLRDNFKAEFEGNGSTRAGASSGGGGFVMYTIKIEYIA